MARQRRYDFELVYGTGPTLDKKSRLEYNDSLMTHAMLFTGYDIKEGETSPNKWRVENSWGDGTGPGKPADPHFVYCTRSISPTLWSMLLRGGGEETSPRRLCVSDIDCVGIESQCEQTRAFCFVSVGATY